MNAKTFSEAMSELDSQYITEAVSYQVTTASAPHFRRFLTASTAAALALFLMGAGISAVAYGENIQSWFQHYWEAATGQQMSEGHRVMIAHLSQTIGVSQTAGNATVTVDSATVGGDENFYLLLRVDGISFSKKHGYYFQYSDMKTTPDQLREGMVSHSLDYLGLDEDGSALFLFGYECVSDSRKPQDTSPLQVRLTLRDIVQDAHTDQSRTLVEGTWLFSFSIDRSQPMEAVSLPDTHVMAICETQGTTGVTLTDIRLTSTGIRFHYDNRKGYLATDTISVVLKNGNIIPNRGGSGSGLTDGSAGMSMSFQWLVPVLLDEVAAVQFGETQIAVP